ncbi:MAG: histidine phosphatase family protein [Desulfosudaceae bacterium]
MSTLYFIRHGQASFGKEDYDALSETEERESERLAAYLEEHDFVFDKIYVGPQVRHRQTARPLLDFYRQQGGDSIEVEEIPEMAEYDFGAVLSTIVPLLVENDHDMNRDVSRMFTDGAAFKRIFEAAALRWVTGDYPPADLMSWPSFVDRVNRGLDKIMARDGRGRQVAVFTSGGPLAVAAQKALGLSDVMAMRLNWQIVNCSLTRFKCTPEQLMLASFNEYPWLREAGPGGDLVTYK